MTEIAKPSNPKLASSKNFGRSRWYPYYAGYSPSFVSSMIEILGAQKGDLVLDPWNGSGTTTTVCSFSGVESVGFDLNPAMAIVAKARLLQSDIGPSIGSLLNCIFRESRSRVDVTQDDPLLGYLGPQSTSHIRHLQVAILKVLSDLSTLNRLDNETLKRLSPIACFYLVVLFRTVRKLLRAQLTRNPTWIRNPNASQRRASFSFSAICNVMSAEAQTLVADGFYEASVRNKADCQIGIADSRILPLSSGCVSNIVTSPPYCTRIDYAVSTRIELAVLGIGRDSGFDLIREKMLGTTVVAKAAERQVDFLPSQVIETLEGIRNHQSKASPSYYYKTFADYFIGMSSSMSEIYRVVKSGGGVALVVQDSNYKDIHIDLAGLLSSQAEQIGFRPESRWDFASSVTMRRLHRASRLSNPPIESVLLFRK